jgi:hypothetical protein
MSGRKGSKVQSIVAGDGGPLTVISTTAGNGNTGYNPAPVINDAGVVAFESLGSGFEVLGTGNGAMATSQVVSTGLNYTSLGPPAINSSGAVAYQAVRAGTLTQAINTTKNDATTTIVDNNGGSFLDYGTTTGDDAPAINDAGQVAYEVTRKNGLTGIFVGDGATAPVALTSNRSTLKYSRPSIDATGDVVYRATSPYGPSGIYLSVVQPKGRYLETIAKNDAKYVGFGAPATTQRGVLGFTINLAGGGKTLALDDFIESVATTVTGPEPVVSTGDLLDDQGQLTPTITQLEFGRHGVSDTAGTNFYYMAFYAKLSDGNSGIYRAAVGVPVGNVIYGNLRLGAVNKPLVKLDSNGALRVVIPSTPGLDVRTIDRSHLSAIRFGDADGTLRGLPTVARLADVNHDGRLDLLLRFSLRRLRDSGALQPTTTRVVLMARIRGQRAIFQATGSVHILSSI